MHRLLMSYALALIAMTPAFGEMIIEGKVTLPPRKVNTAALARYKLKSGQVAMPESPSAVIYLEGSFPRSTGAATNAVSQKGFQFSSALVPIQKDSAIEFPNEDDDYHHVFSYSKPKEFDLGRYRKDERPPPIRFPNPGVVKVGCEIHDHMRTVILVLETAHFTRSDTNGNYRLVLQGVPDGKYTLKAWVNERTQWERQIDVKDGATATIHFHE